MVKRRVNTLGFLVNERFQAVEVRGNQLLQGTKLEYFRHDLALFRQFFQSVNTRDEVVLTNTCESLMTSFLGKPDATKSDVVTFLDKIWKDDVTNMTWRINNDYTISKKEVGDDDYEYTVQFSAVQSKTTEESSKPTNTLFRINAKVSPNDKISSFSMVKIIE